MALKRVPIVLSCIGALLLCATPQKTIATESPPSATDSHEEVVFAKLITPAMASNYIGKSVVTEAFFLSTPTQMDLLPKKYQKGYVRLMVTVQVGNMPFQQVVVPADKADVLFTLKQSDKIKMKAVVEEWNLGEAVTATFGKIGLVVSEVTKADCDTPQKTIAKESPPSATDSHEEVVFAKLITPAMASNYIGKSVVTEAFFLSTPTQMDLLPKKYQKGYVRLMVTVQVGNMPFQQVVVPADKADVLFTLKQSDKIKMKAVVEEWNLGEAVTATFGKIGLVVSEVTKAE